MEENYMCFYDTDAHDYQKIAKNCLENFSKSFLETKIEIYNDAIKKWNQHFDTSICDITSKEDYNKFYNQLKVFKNTWKFCAESTFQDEPYAREQYEKLTREMDILQQKYERSCN
jgi:hypothetical protein